MQKQRSTAWRGLCAAVALVVWASAAVGVPLDERGEIRLGLRAYTGVRIGTERTSFTDEMRDISFIDPASGALRTESMRVESRTFPQSSAGHMRQHRYFVEIQLNHDLRRLVREGFGPLALLNHLPFKVSDLKYVIVFRGEAEGIYDYGPREYRTASQFFEVTSTLGDRVDPRLVSISRRRLRRLGVHRERLFQASVDAQIGDLFMRLGRQILVWGETDAFRLLDNINPTDSSFGGFLIPLDERRVPLDMVRLNYYFGTPDRVPLLGRLPAFARLPFYEMYIEGFAAVDNAVGFVPGTPGGSPWALPNSVTPDPDVKSILRPPARTLSDARWGFQLKFNTPIPLIGDATLGFAYYRTFFDVPAVDVHVLRGNRGPALPSLFPDDDPHNAGFPPDGVPGFSNQVGRSVKAFQVAPKVEVIGTTSTFVVPAGISRRLFLSGEPVIRTELAYFHGEPRWKQSDIDPFMVFVKECSGPDVPTGTECAGGARTGDSWNFVLGIDTNQFIRFLNPHQSFFISTQFFYKHLNGAIPRRPIDLNGDGIRDFQFRHQSEGEVIPVVENRISPPFGTGFPRDLALAHNPADQYLQTLLISTSYYSGQVNPSLTLFYDWSGSFVFQPALTLLRDPFRFTMSYSFLTANRLRGGSGTSLLRDRDNVLFQFEYVI